MEALGHTRKSRAVQGWRVVNSSGRGGNWGRTELCIAITLQIHSTQTCTLSSTSPYSTSITPHAQQHFQVKARDQKQKTAFQIFHFICKGKRRKIEMIIFFLLAHSINICLSVFQYFTTYLYENPLPVFFFSPWPLKGFHSCYTTPRNLPTAHHPHLHSTKPVPTPQWGSTERISAVSKSSRRFYFNQPTDNPQSPQWAQECSEACATQLQPCPCLFSPLGRCGESQQMPLGSSGQLSGLWFPDINAAPGQFTEELHRVLPPASKPQELMRFSAEHSDLVSF